MPIAPIIEIIAEIKAGRMVVLVDEEDRENEGDLVFAADCVTADAINFMARYGRGLVCMPITEDRARQLNLTPMTPVNRSVHGTNFTVSIEAARGVSTGISAADRALTIRVAAAAHATPDDIVHPGHERGVADGRRDVAHGSLRRCRTVPVRPGPAMHSCKSTTTMRPRLPCTGSSASRRLTRTTIARVPPNASRRQPWTCFEVIPSCRPVCHLCRETTM